MSGHTQEKSKIVRTIKTHNDVFEGTAYKKQNNVLRMGLFYVTCALVLLLASYGGLYFEKGYLHDGILQNDAAQMKKSIDFEMVNDGIVGQMPGMLDEIKKDPNDKYANSMKMNLDSPELHISTDNLVDILIKAGFVRKTADGLAFTDFDWKTAHWAYSQVSVILTSKEHPKDVLTLKVAKEGSILIWHVVGAYMSTSLRNRVLN